MSGLKYSKTWPVSTMAVVQLRVDPKGRAYSKIADNPSNTIKNISTSSDVRKVHSCNCGRDKKMYQSRHRSESIKVDNWDLIYIEKTQHINGLDNGKIR